MSPQLPKGAAQLILWRKGIEKPLVWLVSEVDAKNAQDAYNVGNEFVTFKSWPNGSGASSESLFQSSELCGVTVEVPTLQMVGL